MKRIVQIISVILFLVFCFYGVKAENKVIANTHQIKQVKKPKKKRKLKKRKREYRGRFWFERYRNNEKKKLSRFLDYKKTKKLIRIDLGRFLSRGDVSARNILICLNELKTYEVQLDYLKTVITDDSKENEDKKRLVIKVLGEYKCEEILPLLYDIVDLSYKYYDNSKLLDRIEYPVQRALYNFGDRIIPDLIEVLKNTNNIDKIIGVFNVLRVINEKLDIEVEKYEDDFNYEMSKESKTVYDLFLSKIKNNKTIRFDEKDLNFMKHDYDNEIICDLIKEKTYEVQIKYLTKFIKHDTSEKELKKRTAIYIFGKFKCEEVLPLLLKNIDYEYCENKSIGFPVQYCLSNYDEKILPELINIIVETEVKDKIRCANEVIQSIITRKIKSKFSKKKCENIKRKTKFIRTENKLIENLDENLSKEVYKTLNSMEKYEDQINYLEDLIEDKSEENKRKKYTSIFILCEFNCTEKLPLLLHNIDFIYPYLHNGKKLTIFPVEMFIIKFGPMIIPELMNILKTSDNKLKITTAYRIAMQLRKKYRKKIGADNIKKGLYKQEKYFILSNLYLKWLNRFNKK